MRDVAYRVKNLAGWRCERCHHPTGCLSLPNGRHRSYALPCDATCDHPGGAAGDERLLTVVPLNGDHGTWRLWNLLVLCTSCAIVIEAHRQLALVDWPFSHAPWLKRHVVRYEREQEREQRRAIVRSLSALPRGVNRGIDAALDVVMAAARRLGGEVTHHPSEAL